MPPFELVLVNPGVAVPTGPVFNALNARSGLGAIAPPPSLASIWDLVAYLADAGNDLEGPAGRFCPGHRGTCWGALGHEPACVLAQMSGSGATCFGLFDGAILRKPVRRNASPQEHPHWWVRSNTDRPARHRRPLLVIVIKHDVMPAQSGHPDFPLSRE